MKRIRIPVLPYERAALHAKLGKILKYGNPAEILLVSCLFFALRPPPRRKVSKKKGQQKLP